jgi:hypothetical protein
MILIGGSATKTSNTPFGTPSWHRIGLRTSGDETPAEVSPSQHHGLLSTRARKPATAKTL